MPREAPVTRAVLPVRVGMIIVLVVAAAVYRRSPTSWKSCVQEQRGVPHKQLGVLKLRSVIGVGVDDELRVRDVLLHDEGVHRGHDYVVTAVHDERWLLDRLQRVVRPRSVAAPLAPR